MSCGGVFPFNSLLIFLLTLSLQPSEKVVLKVVLSQKEFRAELEALKQMQGKNMVKLLDYDLDEGVMILERLRPGTTLAEVEDERKAAYIASSMMKTLWVPALEHTNIETVIDLENSLKRIARQNPDGFGPISKETIEDALEIFEKLNGDIKNPYLLHGDLHHYNILRNGDSWTMIDPKGLIGDREYDVIQYLLNKLPEANVKETIEKRVDIFVEELDLDKERLLLRGYSHAVLSTCWTIEDGNFSKKFMKTIEIFKELCEECCGNGFK
jgi:streptomycin 6-kinase